MSKKLISMLLGGALLGFIVPQSAFALAVDGDLRDWGVTLRDSTTSRPASVFSRVDVGPGARLFGVAVEDSDDRAGRDGYLGPHYGGQNYDVEFMAVAFQGGRIFLSIATGQRPDNGFESFSPGDVRIVDDRGQVFGLEVGGGAGGAASPGSVRTGAAGTTYRLDGSGVTTGVRDTAAAQTAGSIWSNVDWIGSPIAGDGAPVQFSINASSQRLGSADYIYTLNTSTQQHAVIELAFDASLFAGASRLDFSWAPSCNNDVLFVTDDLPGGVPEPSSIALAGLALAGLVGARRRQQRRATRGR